VVFVAHNHAQCCVYCTLRILHFTVCSHSPARSSKNLVFLALSYVRVFLIVGQTAGPIRTKPGTRTHPNPGSFFRQANVKVKVSARQPYGRENEADSLCPDRGRVLGLQLVVDKSR